MSDINAEIQSTVTPSWGPTAIDNEAEALIKEISKEYEGFNAEASVRSAEVTGETPIEQLQTQPDKVADNTVIPPKPSEPKKEETFDVAGLERLVTREAAIREREKALEAKEKEWAGRKPVDQEVAETFRTSASEALKKMGYDPDQIVRRVIAERLGEKAPPQLKTEIEEADKDARYIRRIEEIERKLAEKDRELQARSFFDNVNHGAKDFVSKGIGEYAPTVASIASKNPDRVHREIMDEIIRDAQVRQSKEPDGQLLTFEEAAKRVEARWSELSSFFGSPGKTSMNPGNETAAKQESQPIDSTSKPSPTTGAPAKAPDRPLAPWLQTRPIEDEGVKAGLAEYYRLMKQGG